MLSVDIIRTVWTYAIATLVIGGGMLFLYQAMTLPSDSRDQLIIGAVIALTTTATSYVFGEQIAARASARTARATQAGVDSSTASGGTP